jgi:aromatic-L-amino-acid decarboxylase
VFHAHKAFFLDNRAHAGGQVAMTPRKQAERDFVPVKHKPASDREQFRRDAEAAIAWVADYLERVRDLPVGARVEPGDVRGSLPPSPPEEGEPFEALLRDLDEKILPGITHWNHPRFLAYFANTGSEPGILAELLAATLNVNAMLWSTSPAGTEVEELAVDWLRQLVGLPEGLHGHIEDTASIATISALAAARELRPGGSVLASEQANFSVEKAARLVGLPFRALAVDEEFRLRADAVAAEIDGAAAVVTTSGTTSSTAVDPTPEIAELCERAGVWLHLDAAYAGSAAVCEEFRWALAGAERADSVVINPHKWLVTPMDCSCVWTRRPEVFFRAFSADPEYMPDRNTQVTDLKDYGPALGRRFRGLKLWAVLRCYGRDGLQALIREHVRLAQLFASWVEETEGWELVVPPAFSVVCFRREGSDEENQAIINRVNDSGEAFLSGTRLNGRFVLRLAVGNARTREEDVARAWELLNDADV